LINASQVKSTPRPIPPLLLYSLLYSTYPHDLSLDHLKLVLMGCYAF
jgi:hypothetical protein